MSEFLLGWLIGAGITLISVIVGWLIGRFS